MLSINNIDTIAMYYITTGCMLGTYMYRLLEQSGQLVHCCLYQRCVVSRSDIQVLYNILGRDGRDGWAELTVLPLLS